MFRLVIALALLSSTQSFRIGQLVVLRDAAEATGAVCLDGSPSSYYYSNGTGPDARNWIVHLEGGGWCRDEENCYNRSQTSLGSSTHLDKTKAFGGFLDNDPKLNPKFSNWTVAFINYCDGASFAGEKSEPILVDTHKVYFRGRRILSAVIDDILTRGLAHANAVILTGCSAGGLSTYIHLDYFRSRVPASIPVHGLADAGYFIDAANADGDMEIRGVYQYIYRMQNCSGAVNDACVRSKAESDRWQCFMAQYTYPHIKTPIFVLNSEYDTWQLRGILHLDCLPPNCSAKEMEAFVGWRATFLNALTPAMESPMNGLFTDSCLFHCQSVDQLSWMEVSVNGQSAHDTFAAWYFGSGGEGKEVDKPYPNNPTCKG